MFRRVENPKNLKTMKSHGRFLVFPQDFERGEVLASVVCERMLGFEGAVQRVYIGSSELSEVPMGGRKFQRIRIFEPEDPRSEE
jgi:hypothetical protein